MNWKKTYQGEKPDKSKTFQFETKKKYLNIFSEDKGKTYHKRIMLKDEKNFNHKIIFQKRYKHLRNALRGLK